MAEKPLNLWDEITAVPLSSRGFWDKRHGMKKTGSILQLVASILLMPVFFVAFCLLYNPFGIIEYYSFGGMSYSFHLTMLGCIILLTYIPTRIMYSFLNGKAPFSTPQRIGWQLGEMFLCACFMALYTCLFKKGDSGWFTSLAVCMKYSFLVLCYPAAMTAIARNHSGNGTEEEGAKADGNLVKLYDEHKRLKLTIVPSSILYVNSDSNYVTVHYTDAGKAKEYQLRSSMKSAEESLAQYGMTRCHRSYLINPRHVSMLGKGADGFTYATLDIPGTPRIPVSKQYCGSLSELL